MPKDSENCEENRISLKARDRIRFEAYNTSRHRHDYTNNKFIIIVYDMYLYPIPSVGTSYVLINYYFFFEKKKKQ